MRKSVITSVLIAIAVLFATNANSATQSYDKQKVVYHINYDSPKKQGGALPSLDTFVDVEKTVDVIAENDGFVHKIDALAIGLAAMKLGAGRATKEDDIDPDVGIVLSKKVADKVSKGDKLATLYVNHENVDDIYTEVINAFTIKKDKISKRDIIFEVIT